jgi:hypothetical protein
MDTRFWGPYGWDFLHSIPLEYDINNKKKYYQFFKSVGEMLPCKYCRISYKQYFKELDINQYLNSKTRLAKWLYLLHNKVNDKLRQQGLNTKKDPTFKEVKARVEYNKDRQETLKMVNGIEFIYIIAFHYKNTMIKNKEVKYKKFFYLLCEIFPVVQVRKCLKKLIRSDFKHHSCGMLKWWNNTYKKAIHNCDYKCDICIETCRNKCEAHISGCKKKSYNGNTCRKKRRGRLSKLKTRKNI